MFKSKQKKKIYYIVIAIFALLCMGLTIVAISYVKIGSKKDYEKKIELGNRYLTELDYESAIAAFEDVIEIEPNCVDAYMGLAQAYTESGKYEEAISILDAAIEKTESEELTIYRIEVQRLKKEYTTVKDQELTETDDYVSDERDAVIKMPDFRGCSESYAVEKIKELGFEVTVDYEPNGRISSGNVISQNIEPESELPENAKIELLVSMGTPRITLDQNEIEIHPGESIRLQAQFVGDVVGQFAVIWRSDNENVAKIDMDGNVTAYVQGECNISATVGNDYCGYDTKTCRVYVTVLEDTVIRYTEEELLEIVNAYRIRHGKNMELNRDYYWIGEQLVICFYSWTIPTEDGTQMTMTSETYFVDPYTATGTNILEEYIDFLN